MQQPHPTAAKQPHTSTALALGLAAAALAALGTSFQCNGNVPRRIVQIQVERAGYDEPHTPGAGGALETPSGPTLQALLGAGPQLNRISTVRTIAKREHGRGPRPGAVLILIPGFLGGSGTFDPIARDLVASFGGALEVWALDRRPQQLEDRRGALHARGEIEAAAELGDEARIQQALEEIMRFYYEDLDLDGDGEIDPPFELPDAGGEQSSFLRLAQDHVRFMAHWGVDTYVRDWRLLVAEARRRVGPHGIVLLGGHSQGTTWAGLFAAYDFDPGPGVEAGHDLIDGLLLLEGGGPRGPNEDAPDLASYRAQIDALATPGGPAVFLTDLFGFGIDPVDLGAAGEISGLAGTFDPTAPAILKKGDLFGGFPLSLLFLAPMTNRSLVGFFLDDDFSANPAFSASMGFSDNGDNFVIPIPGDFYVAGLPNSGNLRTWKNFDDPTLPTCPPNDPMPSSGDGVTGCALLDNGPKPGPGEPGSTWGHEREITDVHVFIRTLYENANASEWYFASGRPTLDFSYGRDSSALGDESLLATTANATVDVPVLAIGASNGLATTEESFADYLGSIATPLEDQEIVILEGYSHVDVVSAENNEAVPPIANWIYRILDSERRPTPPGRFPKEF